MRDPVFYVIVYSTILSVLDLQKKGCNRAGVYGINCSISCPTNCLYNTCHIQYGKCFECKPGWTGTVCNTGLFIYSIYILFAKIT